MVDSPFNEYSKNIFILGGPNFGEGLPENVRKMGNNRDIYCYANQGWSISKENISLYRSAGFCQQNDDLRYLYPRYLRYYMKIRGYWQLSMK